MLLVSIDAAAICLTVSPQAFGLIIRTLNNEPLDAPSTPQSKTYPLRLLIPHILIGSIIGKCGVRIREIQEASGARLNASDSCLALSTERSLVVLGVADAVHIATYYVGSTLVEQLTERFGGPAASAYATRSGAPAGVVPGGMQVVPYVPQPAGGQWGPPENFRQRGNPAQRPPQAGYPMQPQQPYGQPPQQHAQPPIHYGAASPRQAYAGAGPHAPTPYGAHPAQPSAGHASHAGPPQQPVQGMVPGQPLTQQIFIPNDMVGAIIGKGGAKINEIRQLSGSVIKINEPQDNSNERLVTITGTQECNQMALFMLYSRLGESHLIMIMLENANHFRRPGTGRPEIGKRQPQCRLHFAVENLQPRGRHKGRQTTTSGIKLCTLREGMLCLAQAFHCVVARKRYAATFHSSANSSTPLPCPLSARPLDENDSLCMLSRICSSFCA